MNPQKPRPAKKSPQAFWLQDLGSKKHSGPFCPEIGLHFQEHSHLMIKSSLLVHDQQCSNSDLLHFKLKNTEARDSMSSMRTLMKQSYHSAVEWDDSIFQYCRKSTQNMIDFQIMLIKHRKNLKHHHFFRNIDNMSLFLPVFHVWPTIAIISDSNHCNQVPPPTITKRPIDLIHSAAHGPLRPFSAAAHRA